VRNSTEREFLGGDIGIRNGVLIDGVMSLDAGRYPFVMFAVALTIRRTRMVR
jgi:hypothetical protein